MHRRRRGLGLLGTGDLMVVLLRQGGMLAESGVGADRPPQDHARLRHGRGNDLGIFARLGKSVLKKVPRRPPGLQRRLHRRRRNGEVVKPAEVVNVLSFLASHSPAEHGPLGWPLRRRPVQVARAGDELAVC